MPGSYLVNKAIELDALSARTRAQLTEERHWLISKKYDGCHALFEFADGKFVKAFSRTGEPVRSMDHVGRQLAEIFKDWVQWPARFVIDGEAWNFGEQFNEISGKFRQHAPCPTLGFVPFDILGYDNDGKLVGIAGLPYYKRATIIEEAQNNQPAWCGSIYRYTPQRFTGSFDEALEEAKKAAVYFANIGFYDGAVLARSNGEYTVGSGKEGNFIKVKVLQSYTVTVTGAALDFGTKTGKNTAALKFMLDGLEQKVSTGLTQEQVDEITTVGWNGYRIEVEAMGKTSNGYLREPRFKGIRTDA